MDINAIYQALLGRPAGQADLDYWTKITQGEGAPTQEQVQGNLGAINSAFQQLLGRDMQEGTGSALNPIFMDSGIQGVRGHIAGSDEYINSLLGEPGSKWQQVARQDSMHQAQLPGSFWDYSNRDLSTPGWAEKVLGITGSASGGTPSTLDDILKQITGDGTAAEASPSPAGTVADTGGQGGMSYPSQAHGYTLTPEQQAMLGTDFIGRSRDAHAKAQAERYSAKRKAQA